MGFLILLVFIISYFLHLTSRIPLLGTLRFDLTLMIVLAFVSFFQSREKIEFTETKIKSCLLTFICYFVITIPFVKWPGSVIGYGTEFYLKVVLFFFFITQLVKSEKQLKVVVAVIIGCQVFRGLEPVYLHLTSGYMPEKAFSNSGQQVLMRLAGAPHDVISANPYAWVIVSTFPFLYYLLFLKNFVLKLIAAATAVVLCYGLILSGSRTGLVISVTVVLAILYFSKKNARTLVVTASVGLIAAHLVDGVLTPELSDRYLSLVDSSVTGGDTAQGRFKGVKTALGSVASVYGILGHGLGTSKEVNANYFRAAQVSHNIYVELLQEVGVVGFCLFCLYIKSIFTSLQEISLRLPVRSYQWRLVTALKVWIIMDLVYGFACYGVSSWEWYLFGGLSAASISIFGKQQAEAFSSAESIAAGSLSAKLVNEESCHG